MKKIAILSLHNNFGGVEKAIASQANMFVDNYDVEIACTYNIVSGGAFPIDNRVKIKYLTEYTPNKEEVLKYIKEKKLIKAFKEGLKSLKIIYLKRKTMIEYIKNTDADIIISSRITFTKYLSKYQKKGIVTIAEEHAHHNNNIKYLNNLKKSCKNINYLIALTSELANDYKKILSSTKVIVIPNCIDYLPKKLNNLNTKNLISIGRLSYEKGFHDLIDVFELMYKKDKELKLHIIGDGKEYYNLKNKIKEKKLENNITLHGFKTKEEINKILPKMSLYLMSSLEESFGIVLIEAGAFGIPQIAFDSAQGANCLIINNKSGYLIKNRNIENMANTALKLLSNSQKMQDFGKKSHDIAVQYSYENVKEKWLKFLQGV